nr:hypothetical protein [Bartonella raoultii]
MLRFLLKLIAFIFTTLAIIISVIDSTRSISAAHWTTTPLKTILVNLLKTDIYNLDQALYNALPAFLSSICIILISLPAWFIFAALAIIFCILNYEKQKPFYKTSYTKRQYI